MFEIYRSYDERKGSSICTHQHNTTPQESSHCTQQGENTIKSKSKSKSSSSSSSSSSSYIVDLSWSLWGEFFESYKNDVYKGKVIYSEGYKVGAATSAAAAAAAAATKEIYYIDRPVFILPMITLHVGHVLVDLLEEVCTSQPQRYTLFTFKLPKDLIFCYN